MPPSDQSPETHPGTSSAAAADQLLSVADQARLDSDQSSSARDQIRADADLRASKRDRTASELDRSMHASTDAKFREALADIEKERERTSAERGAAAQERVRAGGDRTRAAQDRSVAAADRSDAALDRELARIQLEKARSELEIAQLDDLTGFYRRGLGMNVLQREVDRCRRFDVRLVLAYCDVDGLKMVNDEKGHAAGDALLKRLSESIRSRLRSYDPVVRVGGDEFVCALTELDLEQAAEILRDVQNALAFGGDGATVSFGLAAMQPDDDLETLLARADRALRESRSASLPERASRPVSDGRLRDQFRAGPRSAS